MKDTGVYFTDERNGYDREQVDNYIKMLSEAYKDAYAEYKAIQSKYDDLLADSKKADAREHAGLNSDVISKMLINTEILAQKIISDAQTEAAAVTTEAKRIIDEANSMADRSRVTAKQIIVDANSEAERIVTQARKNLEHANKTMGYAAREVHKLLTFTMPEPESAAAV